MRYSHRELDSSDWTVLAVSATYGEPWTEEILDRLFHLVDTNRGCRIRAEYSGVSTTLLDAVRRRLSLSGEQMREMLDLTKSDIQQLRKKARNFHGIPALAVINCMRLLHRISRLAATSENLEADNPSAWLGQWLYNQNENMGMIAPSTYISIPSGFAFLESFFAEDATAFFTRSRESKVDTTVD